MPGYKLFNKCRQGKKGDGLCTLVSSDCISCQIDNVNLTTEYIEYLCVELNCRTRNVILANVYRPPNSNVKASIKELQLLFDKLTKSYDSIIVCTDHNLDLVKSSTHSSTQDFLEMCIDMGLYPSITKPTRITHSSVTLIDNIFLSAHLHDNCSSTILLEDTSDHLPCLISVYDLRCDESASNVVVKRTLTDKVIHKIKTDLTEINWCQLFDNLGCDDAFDDFYDKLTCIIDSHAPLKCVNKKVITAQPWVSKGLAKCYKKQKKLYAKTLKRDTNNDIRKNYREYRSVLQKATRWAKRIYYSSKCKDFKKKYKKTLEFDQ